MTTLFGMPMDSVMHVMLGIVLIVTGVVAVLALRNRLLFKLGLRNLPRRRAQTTLIVFGLMLSTVIITSAFGTGDTLSYSIRSNAVSGLGAVDEIVTTNAALVRDRAATGTGAGLMPATMVDRVRSAISPASNVDGVTGVIAQAVPLVDSTSRQSKAAVTLLAVPTHYPAAFGSLTTSAGSTAALGALGANEVYLNQYAADALNAHVGDRVAVYVGNHPMHAVVRSILSNQGLAAGGLMGRSDYVILLPLERVGALAGLHGQINMVLVSNKGDAMGGASLSDSVTAQLRAALASPARVATAAALLRAPAGTAALHAALQDSAVDTKTHGNLLNLQAQLARPGASATLGGLLSDTKVEDALQKHLTSVAGQPLSDSLTFLSTYNVQPAKQDGLSVADMAGSEVTSVFIIFGLFSIAAGIMLIFLIFVMLAAERRAEMGMARAIGTKRRHLIQQFLFEGYAYDLGASLVGMVLGIAVGLGLVTVMASLFGGDGFVLTRHIEPRSMAVAFSLGALVTFITVLISSWRVSRLNVVAAIRDLPDDLRLDGSIGDAFRRPLTDLATVGRRLRRGRVLGALLALLAAPWHFLTAFRVFISRGPLLLAVSYPLYSLGVANKDAFPFSLGISLGLIGAALLVRWIMGGLGVPDQLRNRIGYTLAGLSMVVFWLLPFDFFRSDLNVDINMFFLSGMMLMLGGIWTVMYNADLLLGATLRLLGGLGRLAPVVKTAVTYPLQQRFRTGMTLFMFSLVIFSLMVQSVLIGSFSSQSLNLNTGAGGYQVWGATSSSNPIHGVHAQIAANPTLRGRITAAGSVAQIGVTLRQSGPKGVDSTSDGAAIADASYLSSTHYPLHIRAKGYSTDAQVWQAVRMHPGYAVVRSNLVTTGTQSGFIKGFTYDTQHFTPVHLRMQDMRNGALIPITVIGVIDDLGAPSMGTGADIFTSRGTLAAAHDTPPNSDIYFFRVASGQSVHQAALALGSAFLPNGLDVKEAQVVYDQNRSTQVGFNTMLEGFMGLGLVVGIAALGVIATRSVVERRQQIGMLRALGFQRSMIRNSFLLESGFVAVTGTLIGTVLGLLLGRQVVIYFAKTDPGLTLAIPWAQVALIIVGAYAASLLTTYLPARQAARIFPAEALRYE